MAMFSTEQEELVRGYLESLERMRAGLDADDDGVWASFDELISSNPRVAATLVEELLRRSSIDDAPMIGAGLLRTLLLASPQLSTWFGEQIERDDSFFRAAQFLSMTGVPLDAQQRINAALGRRGVDPRYLVEYDEED